jgi:pSer/pThr/pTyr-binding forkhead associated (FHA) protein/uncharacterized RDD family membrane protein YckC
MDEYKLILGDKEIALSPGIAKIGRAPSSDILLEDRRVSSNHAQIELYENKLFLKDLNSRNGTYVNGRRIHDTVELSRDDIIQIVTYKFNIKMPEMKGKPSGTILDLSRPCPKCGERVSRGYQFCPYCGTSLERKKEAAKAVVEVPEGEQGEILASKKEPAEAAKKRKSSKRDTAAMKPMKFSFGEEETYEVGEEIADEEAKEDIFQDKKPAGFWLRFAAYILDAIFLNIISFVFVTLPIALIMYLVMGIDMRTLDLNVVIQSRQYIILYSINLGLLTVISIIYFLYGWARKGTTWGKYILGLKIYTIKGKTPIGWGRAILRVIGYFISSFILWIGFIMIGFTDRKRGLHDMIAGTYVLRKR